MPKKKSVKKAAEAFERAVVEIRAFILAQSQGSSQEHISWIHEYGIIRLYREFENLMLQALVGAVNNDTSTISERSGIGFPKHLTDEVCEFLILGNGFFDFKGREGLIKTLKGFVPAEHYLVTILKKVKYLESLNRLSALRNFAAHGSRVSKKRALTAVSQKRMGTVGSWLKVQGRFDRLCTDLVKLVGEIEAAAPY